MHNKIPTSQIGQPFDFLSDSNRRGVKKDRSEVNRNKQEKTQPFKQVLQGEIKKMKE